jgi:hypothetical protein
MIADIMNAEQFAEAKPVEIKINQTYMRSAKPYDVCRVIDVILKGGKVTVKCIEVYGFSEGPFYVPAEDTKAWQLF